MRDQYRELIGDKVADAEATRQVLAENADFLDDPDNGPVVWLALAVSQSGLGRLDPDVAQRALHVIDDGEGMRAWQEKGPGLAARRQAALAKVRAQLTGPQPPRRIPRRPRPTTLRPGEVLARRGGDGRYLLLRVARLLRGEPVVVPLDYYGDQIPGLASIAELADCWFIRSRPRDGVPGDSEMVSFQMSVYQKVDYPQAGYVVVGDIGTRPGEEDLDPMILADWQKDLLDSGALRQFRATTARQDPGGGQA